MTTVYVASKAWYGLNWQDHRSAWEALGVTVNSSWIDEYEPGVTDDFAALWEKCVEEASSADLLIAVHHEDEVWKGAFLEIGCALSHGKPVYIVGSPPGTWVNHPLITLAESPDDAIYDYLERPVR